MALQDESRGLARRRLEPGYGPSRSGTVARRYLSLDQAMVLGALGSVVGHQVVWRAFTRGAVARRIRPLIGQERFSAGTAS